MRRRVAALVMAVALLGGPSLTPAAPGGDGTTGYQTSNSDKKAAKEQKKATRQATEDEKKAAKQAAQDEKERRKCAAQATAGCSYALYLDATIYGWQATGIVLGAGDTAVLEPDGLACFDEPDGSRVCHRPSGAPNDPRVAPGNSPWPGGKPWGLIGMIGGEMMLVGNEPTVVSGPGELYLAFNDDTVDDNVGGFHVTITVR